MTTLRPASLHGALEVLAFFAILAILAFLAIFWLILILGQFVITPYSNIFDWSSGLGEDSSGQTTDIVTQSTVLILVRFGNPKEANWNTKSEIGEYLEVLDIKVDEF